MTERLLTLFGIVAIIEVLAGAAVIELDAPAVGLRLLHLGEMLLLIVFALDRFHLRDRVPRLIFAGLLLSFAGDVVIAFDVPPLFALPPSAAAHVCYITAFLILIQNHASDRNAQVRWPRELAVWPFLAVGLWFLVIDRSAPLPLLAGSFVYAFVVTLMGITAVLLGRRVRRYAWFPAAGGVSYVVSDSIFGLFLLDGADRPDAAAQLIWITYFLAQVLIAHAAALPRRQTQFG